MANKRKTSHFQHDAVNHPPHYTAHPSGVECIQITEHMEFCVGNAVKYLWRAGLKGGSSASEIQDLEKAAWYVQRRISKLKMDAARREKAESSYKKITVPAQNANETLAPSVSAEFLREAIVDDLGAPSPKDPSSV